MLQRPTREIRLAMLESKGARALAELLLDKSAWDQSLQNQFDVMILHSNLSPNPDLDEANAFLDALSKLCEFHAEWRERDSGWAMFLEEVVSSVTTLLERFPFPSIHPQIRNLIQIAEESSHQMDDCYSCDEQIEKLESLLNKS